MAIARDSANLLEQQIGYPPRNEVHKTRLLERLQDGTLAARTLRDLMDRWLVTQGIPASSAKSATAISVATAYAVGKYLAGWRKRINPNFGLLADDDDDDEIPAPAPAPTGAGGSAPAEASMSPQGETWLRQLYQKMEETTTKIVDLKLSQAKLVLDAEAKAQIKSLASEMATSVAKQVVADALPPRRIEILRPEGAGGETIVALGHQHERFPLLLRLAQMRNRDGYAPNIWLTGVMGSGKTSAWFYVAKALGLEFEAESSLDADYKVMGHKGPNGEYHETAFFRRFTQGGIILFDEIDNFAPSAALCLNAATANNWCQFPHGMFQRHKDCIIVACANTWGLGASNDYVGRTRLDAATLDRFHPKIAWPIDTKLERAIAGDILGDKGLMWHDFILRMRDSVVRQGLKIIISPRMTYAGCEHLKEGFTWQECVDMIVAPGLSAEQRKAIGCDTPSPFASETIVWESTNGMMKSHSEALADDYLRNCIIIGQKITAIKRYRELTGSDLLTAKDAIESLEMVA